VKTVPTGRTPHELVEVLEVTHCTDCGQPLESRLYTLGYLSCLCAGTAGHRRIRCLREGCHGVMFDPPHVIQHGPTASYGGG
jgi:hypothetical protein